MVWHQPTTSTVNPFNASWGYVVALAKHMLWRLGENAVDGKNINRTRQIKGVGKGGARGAMAPSFSNEGGHQ